MTVNHKNTSNINRLLKRKFLASRVPRGYGGLHSPHKKVLAGAKMRFLREKDPSRASQKLGGVPVRVGGDLQWQRPPRIRP